MKKHQLTEDELEKVITEIDEELLNKANWKKFSYNINWNNDISKKPGVYAAFEKDELIYIGQTADLKSRMSDIRRTYNHTLRKKIGKERLKASLVKNKFSNEIEEKLTQYMVEHISFSFQPISFGRLEVESQLVKKYAEQLLNSKSVRGLK